MTKNRKRLLYILSKNFKTKLLYKKLKYTTYLRFYEHLKQLMTFVLEQKTINMSHLSYQLFFYISNNIAIKIYKINCNIIIQNEIE